MRISILAAALATFVPGTAVHAQDIVEVPQSEAGVALPDEIFSLPPGQWYVARQITAGNVPCTSDACQAGFNSGDLVVSVEHAKEYVRVIAGFRDCERVAFQEVETGMRPGSRKRSEVSALIKDVVKGAEKSCALKAPSVPKLDIKSLFPPHSS